MANRSTLYSSLIIVISLQLDGCRQIVKPHKYYLVRDCFSLVCIFSLFFLFLTCWEFGLISFILFTACYSMGMTSLIFFFFFFFFLQSFYLFISIFHGSSFIRLISSISAGKSVMERPEEPRSRWTKEEDQRLLERKSRNPKLSWEKIAKLARLNRTGKSCWRRWNLEEPPRS